MDGAGVAPGGRRGWNEREWERYLQRADARSAKFEELYETFRQSPDRDTLIAREMGWDAQLRACGGVSAHCVCCARRLACEPYEMLRLTCDLEEHAQNDAATRALLDSFEAVRQIPAYASAYAFEAHLEERLAAQGAEVAGSDAAQEALLAAQMVPVHVAAGHGIGYGRESLCGNIANVKRALASLDLCRDRLQTLQDQHGLAPAEAEDLRRRIESVRDEVRRWIETLRARTRW